MSKSKYEPHQGKQEIKRRRLQIERSKWNFSGGRYPDPGVKLREENRGTVRMNDG